MIQGEMVATEEHMKNIEAAYEDADRNLKALPGDVQSFKDDYAGKLENANFSIQSAGEDLAAFGKERFEEALNEVTSSVGNTQTKMTQTIQAETRRVLGEVDKAVDRTKTAIADATEKVMKASEQLAGQRDNTRKQYDGEFLKYQDEYKAQVAAMINRMEMKLEEAVTQITGTLQSTQKM